MPRYGISLLSLAMVLMLSACSTPVNAPQRRQTVWDSYDWRHPVPADSRVPVSRALAYQNPYYYSDNDAAYQPYQPPRDNDAHYQPYVPRDYDTYYRPYVPQQNAPKPVHGILDP